MRRLPSESATLSSRFGKDQILNVARLALPSQPGCVVKKLQDVSGMFEKSLVRSPTTVGGQNLSTSSQPTGTLLRPKYCADLSRVGILCSKKGHRPLELSATVLRSELGSPDTKVPWRVQVSQKRPLNRKKLYA